MNQLIVYILHIDVVHHHSLLLLELRLDRGQSVLQGAALGETGLTWRTSIVLSLREAADCGSASGGAQALQPVAEGVAGDAATTAGLTERSVTAANPASRGHGLRLSHADNASLFLPGWVASGTQATVVAVRGGNSGQLALVKFVLQSILELVVARVKWVRASVVHAVQRALVDGLGES